MAVNGYSGNVTQGLELVKLGSKGAVRKVLQTRDEFDYDPPRDKQSVPRLSRIHQSKGINSIPTDGLYLIGGAHEIFFVGCLIEQANKNVRGAAINRLINVPLSPPANHMHEGSDGVLQTTIDINQARWLWELVHSESPSIALSPNQGKYQYMSRAGFTEEQIQAIWAESSDALYFISENLNETAYGLFDGMIGKRGVIPLDWNASDQWISYKNSHPTPEESVMLSRLKKSQPSRNYVCSILRGGINTKETYIAFTELDEGLKLNHEGRLEGGLTIRYYGRVAKGLQSTLGSLSKYFQDHPRVGIVTTALSGTAAVLSGGTTLPFEAILGASAAGILPSIPIFTNLVGKFLPSQKVMGIMQTNFANLEVERKKRKIDLKQGQILARSEDFRAKALIQALLGVVQAAAEENFKSRVIQTIARDMNSPQNLRAYPSLSLTDSPNSEARSKLVERYVARNSTSRKGIESSTAEFRKLDELVLKFLTENEDDALALFSHSVIDVFNSFEIGTDTPITYFERVFALSLKSDQDSQLLAESLRAENLMLLFRQLDDVTKEGSFIDKLSIFPAIYSDEFSIQGRSKRHMDLYREVLTAYLHTQTIVTKTGSTATVRDMIDALSQSASTATGQEQDSHRDLLWQGIISNAAEVDKKIKEIQVSILHENKKNLTKNHCLNNPISTPEACKALLEASRQLSLFIQELDATDQAHRASENGLCRQEFSHQTCEILTKFSNEHVDEYRLAKNLCSHLIKLADGAYPCAPQASYTSLEWFLHRAKVVGVQKAVNELSSSGILITPGSGHWPAVIVQQLDNSFLIQEVNRLRKLEGQSLEPKGYESQILTKVEQLLK